VDNIVANSADGMSTFGFLFSLASFFVVFVNVHRLMVNLRGETTEIHHVFTEQELHRLVNETRHLHRELFRGPIPHTQIFSVIESRVMPIHVVGTQVEFGGSSMPIYAGTEVEFHGPATSILLRPPIRVSAPAIPPAIRAAWGTLSPEIKAHANKIILSYYETATLQEVIRLYRANGDDWWRPFHAYWGEACKSVLRRGYSSYKDTLLAGIDDAQLPTGDWDDYYARCVEHACGLRA
jgi:hypothetical protein